MIFLCRLTDKTLTQSISLDDKREDYQNFSVLCCVWQLNSDSDMRSTHTREQFLKICAGLDLVSAFV